MKVRLAKLADAAEIADIYNHEVLSGVATFDLVPKSLEEQREWLRDRSGALPCSASRVGLCDHTGKPGRANTGE